MVGASIWRRSMRVQLVYGVDDADARAAAKDHFVEHAGQYWDMFYTTHARRFFKDRHYLEHEFDAQSFAQASIMLEVGCGAGNTVLPLLHNHPHLRAYACDFSAVAVSLLAEHAVHAGLQSRLTTFVADLRKPGALHGEGKVPVLHSVDIVTVIFVLSALEPASLAQAAHNLHSILMPGGLVCFRDYAHGDLAELRLAGVGKAPARRHNSPQVDASQVEGEGELTCSMPHPCSTSNFTQQQVYLEEQQTIQQPAYLEEQQSTQAGNSQCLGERLYVRQDGTMCRYFTEEEVASLFHDAGFETVQLLTHDVQRTNVKRGLCMQRRWMQGIFRARMHIDRSTRHMDCCTRQDTDDGKEISQDRDADKDRSTWGHDDKDRSTWGHDDKDRSTAGDADKDRSTWGHDDKDRSTLQHAAAPVPQDNAPNAPVPQNNAPNAPVPQNNAPATGKPHSPHQHANPSTDTMLAWLASMHPLLNMAHVTVCAACITHQHALLVPLLLAVCCSAHRVCFVDSNVQQLRALAAALELHSSKVVIERLQLCTCATSPSPRAPAVLVVVEEIAGGCRNERGGSDGFITNRHWGDTMLGRHEEDGWVVSMYGGRAGLRS